MIGNYFLGIPMLVAVAAACQLPAPTAITDFGYSSCSRTACLFVPDDQHPQTYHQGEFNYSVSESGAFILKRGQVRIWSTTLNDLSASVFVSWSADTNRFAITWSDGGAIGVFRTRVFSIVGDNVTEFDPVKKAFDDFRSRRWCEARGDNAQAYGWSRERDALIIVTSVYPTGDCGKDSGHTEAYFIQPESGEILKHQTLRQFMKYAKSHPQ